MKNVHSFAVCISTRELLDILYHWLKITIVKFQDKMCIPSEFMCIESWDKFFIKIKVGEMIEMVPSFIRYTFLYNLYWNYNIDYYKWLLKHLDEGVFEINLRFEILLIETRSPVERFLLVLFFLNKFKFLLK